MTASQPKEIIMDENGHFFALKSQLTEFQKSMHRQHDITDQKIDIVHGEIRDFKEKLRGFEDRFDKKLDREVSILVKVIDRIDARMWQIIIILLAYPVGLIVGKICHVF